MVELTRTEYIRQALKHIMECVGGRKEFYEKLGATYSSGNVSRATISVWIKNGTVPVSKAGLLASWSEGAYSPEKLCPKIKELNLA